jgi:hypothetical protein
LFAAELPLDKTQAELVKKALESATGEALMKESLEKSGISSVQVIQTRFVGPEKDGVLDVTKKLDLDQLVGTETNNEESSADDSGIDGTTIGIIVGCVAGGIALLALVITLLLSYNRRSQSKDKESLTNQWKLERELAEAERMKLDQENRPSLHGSLRWTASESSGYMSMSREELERKREMRKQDSLAASSRLSNPPTLDQSPKPSRLESMRSALGLGKSTNASPEKDQSTISFGSPTTSAADEVDVESKRKWSVFKK